MGSLSVWMDESEKGNILVVAGVTREWVDAVRANHSSSWELDRFKAVSVRFRRRHGNPDFFGDGFVLWPWQNELWTSLQRSLR